MSSTLQPPASPSETASARPVLRRAQRERVIAGVCAGIAHHLGIPVRAVRLLMAGAGLAMGLGVPLYAFWWATVPPDTAIDAGEDRVVDRRAVADRVWPVTDVAVAGLLLLAAVLLVAADRGVRVDVQVVVPLTLTGIGAAVAWSQLDHAQRTQWTARAGGRTPVGVLRLVGGLVLTVIGVLLLTLQGGGLDDLLRSALAAVVVLGGVGLVLAPWWLRLWRDLEAERTARAAMRERADIAAHLHDSVLQTLSLVRRRSDDPIEVARLVRRQERELREWLYGGGAASDADGGDDRFAVAVRTMAAEVEDAHAVAVDVVVVGDLPPGEDASTAGVRALLAAAREATVNAAVHGAPPVSVYAEVRDDAVEIAVRDRGAGFDLAAIPADRLGVRRSIISRMERHGGTATVRSEPDRGTEVQVSVPRRPRAGESS